MSGLIGGIEGGGTKFVAAVAESATDGPPEIVDRFRVATTEDPDETLGALAEWLDSHGVSSVGVAMFGPIDLERGVLLDTPKPGWSGTDLTAGLGLPTRVVVDTDVNAAAIAESRWGSARDAEVAVYLTVGTGIGGGALVEGRTIHGLLHPEMGHVTVTRRAGDDAPSRCRFHTECLEGLASGPALEARAGRPLDELEPDDAVWALAADYLGQGIAQLAFALSPHVVVMGGGVMQQSGLIDRVEAELADALGDYVPAPRLTPPHFGQESGLYGALALAPVV